MKKTLTVYFIFCTGCLVPSVPSAQVSCLGKLSLLAVDSASLDALRQEFCEAQAVQDNVPSSLRHRIPVQSRDFLEHSFSLFQSHGISFFSLLYDGHRIGFIGCVDRGANRFVPILYRQSALSLSDDRIAVALARQMVAQNSVLACIYFFPPDLRSLMTELNWYERREGRVPRTHPPLCFPAQYSYCYRVPSQRTDASDGEDACVPEWKEGRAG